MQVSRYDRASVRFYRRRYGVSETYAIMLCGRQDLVERVEDWRDANGLPAPDSPLVRGYLLDLLEPR
jgi:hypothetical protein